MNSLEFTCLICDEGFVSSNALEAHMLRRHPGVDVYDIPNQNGIFAYEICTQEFETTRASDMHVSRVHESSTPLVSSALANPVTMLITSSTVEAVKPSRPANKDFARKISDDIFVCEGCNKIFSSRTSVQIHASHEHTLVEIEPANENGKFTCELCGQDFKKTRSRSIHIARKHHIKKDGKHAGAANVISSMGPVAQNDENFLSDQVLYLSNGFKRNETVEEEVSRPSKNKFLQEFIAFMNGAGSSTRDDDGKDFESLTKTVENQRTHTPPSSTENEKSESNFRVDGRQEVVPNEKEVFPTYQCSKNFQREKAVSAEHQTYHETVKKSLDKSDGISSTVNGAGVDISDNAIDDGVSTTPNSTSDETTSTADCTTASIVSANEAPPFTNAGDADHQSESVRPSNLQTVPRDQIEIKTMVSHPCEDRAVETKVVNTNQNIIAEQPPPAECKGNDECTTSVKSSAGMVGHSRAPEDVPPREEKQVAEQTPYQCLYCERSFSKVFSRNAHQKVHKRPNKSSQKVGVHRRKMKPPRRIIREKTGVRWDTSPPNVRCTTRRKFSLDISARTRSWAHKCTQCSTLFANANDLSKHSRTHQFICKLCSKRCSTEATLDAHVETHSSSSAETRTDGQSVRVRLFRLPDTCANSDQTHANTNANPVVVELDEEEQYACDMCDEVFVRRKDLSEHVRLHADPLLSEDSWLPADDECTVASVAAVSSGGDSVNCPMCDRSFRGKRNLSTHMFKIHRKRKGPNGYSSEGALSPLAVANPTILEDKSMEDPDDKMWRRRKRGRKGALKRCHAPRTDDRIPPMPISQFQCDSCGLCFRSVVTLGRHMETECEMRRPIKEYEAVENSDGSVQLELTGKTTLGDRDFEGVSTQNPVCSNFEKSANESFHEEKILEVEKAADIESFICRCCFKIFSCRSDVHLHVGQPQKLLFCCGLCNLYFIDTEKAEKHSMLMHSIQGGEISINSSD